MVFEDVIQNPEATASEPTSVSKIFGHKVFNSRNLTFEPNENAATPQDYRLGPGDEVVIDIWGVSEDHLRRTISPEGSIMIAQLGPIYLNGMTNFDQAFHQNIPAAIPKRQKWPAPAARCGLYRSSCWGRFPFRAPIDCHRSRLYSMPSTMQEASTTSVHSVMSRSVATAAK